jgi:hypothetical protein
MALPVRKLTYFAGLCQNLGELRLRHLSRYAHFVIYFPLDRLKFECKSEVPQTEDGLFVNMIANRRDLAAMKPLERSTMHTYLTLSFGYFFMDCI